MAKRAEEATEEIVDASPSLPNDDLQSIKTLMATHESSRIVSDAREYQLELFERAKKENVIAVLPTGLHSPPLPTSS